MKLNYNILWFEDVKESFNTKKQFVRDIVEDFGFNFPEPKWEINGDNIDTLNFEDYDLIIADLKLSNERGPQLIEKIRKLDVFTEVIFYSSDGEDAVRTELKNHQIDGAYCAGRANEDFEDKVRRVIRTTIKKVQDLNNMRGLIMAETSDIDHIMLNIISGIIEKDLGIKDDLIAEIFKNVGDKVNRKKDAYDKAFRNSNINTIVKDTVMFDSSEKIKAVQFILEKFDHELTHPHRGDKFLNNYTEIKKQRDLLAHVVEVIHEGKKVLRSGERELDFTDEFCIQIRLKVKEHNLSLTSILGVIQN